MKDKTKLRLIKGNSEITNNEFEDIFEHAHESISRIDVNGKYISVNQSYAKICGYSPEEMEGMSWELTVHPDDIEIAQQCYHLMLEEGRAESEFRGLRKNGDIFYKHVVLVKGFESKQSNVSHYCFMQDITSRSLEEKRFLQTIRIDYERYNSLLNNVPSVVYRVNVKRGWQFDFINNAIQDLLKIDIDKCNNNVLKLIYKFTHPDDISRLKEAFRHKKNFAENHFSEEYRMIVENGQTIWVNNTGTLFYSESGELEFIDGVIIDITGTKEMELELEKSEQALAELQRIVSNRQLKFSDKMKRLLEFGIEYLDLEYGVYGLIENDDYVIQNAIVPAHINIKSGFRIDIQDTYSFVTLNENKTICYQDVSDSPVEKTALYKKLGCKTYIESPVYLHNQVVGALCFSGREPRKKNYSEKEINLLQLLSNWISFQLEYQRITWEKDINLSHLETTFKNSPDAIYISELKNGTFLSVNHAFEELSGFDKKYLLNRSISDLNLWVTDQERREFFKRIKQNGKLINEPVTVRHKNGTIRYALLTANLIWFNNQKCILSIARDVTEQKQKDLEIQKYQQAIIALHSITIEKLDLEEKIRRTLDLILDYLDVETVLYGEAIDDHYLIKIVAKQADTSLDISPGIALTREQCIWSIVIDTGKPVSYKQLGRSKYKERYIHKGMGVETYLGTPIYIDNITHGTISCISSRVRKKKFSKTEIDFTILIATWIGLEIEREQASAKLIKNEQVIKNLYQITADHEQTFEEKIDNILKLCANHLAIDIGIYGSLEERIYKVNRVYDVNDVIEPGVELTRAGSYCERTSMLNKVVALPYVKYSDYAKLPGYKENKFETYLGIPIEVGENKKGTICFLGKNPRNNNFTVADIELVQLAAQWIVSEQQRKNVANDLFLSEERQQSMIEIQPQCVKRLTREGDLIYMNAAGLALIEAGSLEEVLGVSVYDLVTEEHHESFMAMNERVLNGETVELEFEIEGIKGTRKWMHTVATPIYSESGEAIEHFAVTHEVTDRKKDESALKAQARALKIINDCNHGIRRLDQLDMLLEYICNVVIESGNFRFCWIGLAENDAEKVVRPICHAGFEEGYLQKSKITWNNESSGNGPTGRCIKFQEPVTIRDMKKDKNFSPWRKAALDRGFRSSIALPIWVNEAFSAALTIYSSEPEAFSIEEVELLSDLANNLTHAIRNIELKDQKIKTERQLIANEEKYRMLVNDAKAIVWELALHDFNFTFVSPAAKNILGYDIEDWYQEGFWPAHIHSDDREAAVNFCETQTEQGLDHEFEYRMIKQDGSVIWVHDIVNIIFENNKPVKLRGLMIDITERKEIEQALKISEERFSLAMQGASDGLWDWDLKTDNVYYSPRWKSMLGYGEHEIEENLDSFTELLHPDDYAKTFKHVEEFQNNVIDAFNIEFRMRHKKGHFIDILSRAFGVKNEQNEMIRIVGTHTDISENTRLSKQLEYQASHDSLTSLVNRAEFENRLQRLLNEHASIKTEHAVCYLDLDNFKVINDTCGHLAGDVMLKQLSELLLASVRARDTLARLGGDEFAILMEHCSIEQAQNVAEKILSIIQEFRFAWDGNKFTVGVSIGLIPINENSGSVIDILSAADSACYLAKDAGRNRIYISCPNDDELEKRKGEMQWVSRINQALEENLYCLFYQEVIPADYEKNKTAKKRFEILIRMKTHDDAHILPGAFMPAAERYNLITKLDIWVFNSTIDWLSDNVTLLNQIETCAINISGHSLSQHYFLNFCLDKINNSGIPGEKICFEITETAAIANLNSAIVFIEKLKNQGCKFALDDFGSGLSSFGYLKNLPVDYVKIDGTFVRDILSDPVDFEMVKVINRLGHIMGKETIAEFVENEDIAAMLKAMGVNYLQGYAISKPKPIDEFEF